MSKSSGISGAASTPNLPSEFPPSYADALRETQIQTISREYRLKIPGASAAAAADDDHLELKTPKQKDGYLKVDHPVDSQPSSSQETLHIETAASSRRTSRASSVGSPMLIPDTTFFMNCPTPCPRCPCFEEEHDVDGGDECCGECGDGLDCDNPCGDCEFIRYFCCCAVLCDMF